MNVDRASADTTEQRKVFASVLAYETFIGHHRSPESPKCHVSALRDNKQENYRLYWIATHSRNDDVFIDVELDNSVHFEKCSRCSTQRGYSVQRKGSHGAFARKPLNVAP